MRKRNITQLTKKILNTCELQKENKEEAQLEINT